MAQVTSWESWGVTAGTPSGVTWHVKNGWLPDATGWHINSIGTFSGHGKNYMIAVLSDNTDMNDDEQYGINTIEDVARLAQRDLNNANLTGSSAAAARLAAAPNVGQPQATSWAVVPALPTPSAASGAGAGVAGLRRCQRPRQTASVDASTSTQVGVVGSAVSRKTIQRSMQ